MFLRTKGGLRTWVAVMAAHVFVLQLLLAGIVATQMAVAAASPTDPFAICHGGEMSADTGHEQPGPAAVHQHCSICTFASTPPLSPVTSQSNVIAFGNVVAFWTPTAPSSLVDQSHSPRTSQGPPQVA